MSSIAFRPDIQGLRAIAVIAVIIYHFNSAWLPGGFVGVDIFLVLSGFLITAILLNKKSQPEYNFKTTIKKFYIGRAKRIVPAYFIMLVIVALIAAVLFIPKDFKVFQQGFEKAAYFSSNYYFAGYGNYFSPTSYEQPLLHTWSLAVEIQFYLLAPFLILLLPIKILKWVFGILLVGLSLVAEYRLRAMGLEQSTYYSLYARLPEFFVGGLSALYFSRNENNSKNNEWISVIGIVLIIAAVFMQPKLGAFPGVAALLPVLGCALLLSYRSQGWVSKILTNSTLIWIGALSYSLYLWHWPVLSFLRYFTGTEILSLSYSLVFLFITLTLSICSYYLIEKTFHKNNIKRKQTVILVLIGVLTVLSILSAKTINKYVSPKELPIEYTRYADPQKICHGKIVGDCLWGELTSDKEVLVLGDSHAALLNYFFDYLGKELGFKARIITASNCVTIPEFDYQHISEWARKACLSQIEEAKKYLDIAETIFLAASWNWQLDREGFKKALESFLQKEASQARKYIISQEPLLHLHPMRNQRYSHFGLGVNTVVDKDYLRTNKFLSELAQKANNSNYLALNELEIFYSVPFYKDMLMYFDKNHLNQVGALEYAKQSIEHIKKAIKSD